jgi:hypothetical protein
MFLKHAYSKDHKVVESSPHNFACGGGVKMADGGDVESPTYWGAVKDRVSELVGSHKTPVAQEPKHDGRTVDDIASEAENGPKKE